MAADQQKKGVGTLLLETIKADLSSVDIPHIILETDKGTPAEQFYYHNGFTVQPDQRALTLVSTTELYQTVFSQAPWFETHALPDVSQYISRLLAMNTNRCYAIWEAKQLIGVALGFSRPWHRGVEYQLLDLA
ncbi:hypothetical protein GQS40_01645|uniref:GNAT family N-acetyltransferase n=1 Tax=Leuconostoc lactis TaxID=1246 RepID=A0A6L7AA16_LEULA|nr:hypothetical protein [Leuconostoc lactis]